MWFVLFFFFKQKTAYEMRISDWSSDVCSSDLMALDAVALLDERWRRRPVGLVVAGSEQEAQPLLSESYYLESALQPFTELRKGTVEELLQRQLAVLAVPDSIILGEDERGRIEIGRAHV